MKKKKKIYHCKSCDRRTFCVDDAGRCERCNLEASGPRTSFASHPSGIGNSRRIEPKPTLEDLDNATLGGSPCVI